MTHPGQPGVRALDRPDLAGTLDAVGYVATAPEFSGQGIIFIRLALTKEKTGPRARKGSPAPWAESSRILAESPRAEIGLPLHWGIARQAMLGRTEVK